MGTSRAVAVAMPPPNSASRFVAVAGAGRMMSTDELRRLTRRIVDSEGAAAVSLSAPAARRTTTRLASLRPLPCASASLSLTLRRLQALAWAKCACACRGAPASVTSGCTQGGGGDLSLPRQEWPGDGASPMTVCGAATPS